MRELQDLVDDLAEVLARPISIEDRRYRLLGVIVSYFEWAQAQQKAVWAAERIESRLGELLHAAFARAVEAGERHGVRWRAAALSVAVGRVAEAAHVRAIYP